MFRIRIFGKRNPRRIQKMMDVEDCKLFLVSPKSGRQNEVVFIPKKVAGRLREYIRSRNIAPEERIFHIGYTGARQVVKKAGRLIGVEISPMISGDMRQHMRAGPGRPSRS